MLKIVHNILVNLDTGIVTTKPPIDIHQGDSRSHVLRFQLCTSTSPFKRIDSDIKFKIEFFDGDTLIKSSDVVIENDVRGLVRYVLTSNITKRPARYTTYLKMVTRDCDNDDVVLAKASFVVTVSEAHDYCPKSSEVILTKDEYEEIQNHIIDSQIHLSKNDRKVLDEMTVNMDAVLRMINESASWTEVPKCKCIKCSCKDCTQESKYLYFSQLPQGKLIFKKDMILKDKNEVDHFIKSPAYGLHSVDESGVHSLTMFSSEDIVQYDESATTCDYRSLKSTLHSHENKEILDTYTETMDDLISQVNQYTDEKISEIDTGPVAELKNRLDRTDASLNETKEKVSQIDATVNSHTDQIETLSSKVDENKESTDNNIKLINDSLDKTKEKVSTLDTDLKQEIVERTQGDADVQSHLEGLVSKEVNDRQVADASLQTLVDKNTADIESIKFEDTKQNTQLQNLSERLTSEVADRKQGDEDTLHQAQNHSDNQDRELENRLNISITGINDRVTSFGNQIDKNKSDIDDLKGSLGKLSGSLVYKGVVRTASDLPINSDQVEVGYTYRVVVAGEYVSGQKPCEVGDLIICVSKTPVEWTIAQTNEDGVVVGPESSSENTLPIFDGVSGKLIKDSGVTIDSIKQDSTSKDDALKNDLLEVIRTKETESKSRDTNLDGKIEALSGVVESNKSDIEDKLKAEISQREQSDTNLETTLTDKIDEVSGNVSALELKHDNFANEVNSKFTEQSNTNQTVLDKLSELTDADNGLSKRIDDEAKERKTEDSKLQDSIGQVQENFTSAVKDIEDNLLTKNQAVVYKGLIPVSGLPVEYNVGDLYLVGRDQELLGVPYYKGDFVVAVQQAKVYIDRTDTSIGFWNKTPGDNYAKFYLDGTKNYDSELGAFVVGDTNKLSLVLHQKYEKDGDLVNSTDYNVGDYHYGSGNVDSAINVTAPQVSIDSTVVQAVLTSDYSDDALTSKGGWVVTNHPNTPASERKIYNIDISFEGLTSQVVDCEIKCSYEFKTRSGWPPYTWSNQNVTTDALSFKFKVYKMSHENWTKVSGSSSTWEDMSND